MTVLGPNPLQAILEIDLENIEWKTMRYRPKWASGVPRVQSMQKAVVGQQITRQKSLDC